MSKVKKITKKQLSSIKKIQQNINTILLDVGYLEARKQDLIFASAEANKEMQEIKVKLEKEYGQININLNDGSYTEVEKEAKELEIVE